MSGCAFDTNIVIDLLAGFEAARRALHDAASADGRVWISRMVWIEVLSKDAGATLAEVEAFLSGFGVDEIDAAVATRAAALRRERSRLRTPDAIILASAQVHGRTLVTRNTRDFPAAMPGIRVPYII